jgi:hypothetical protein
MPHYQSTIYTALMVHTKDSLRCRQPPEKHMKIANTLISSSENSISDVSGKVQEANGFTAVVYLLKRIKFHFSSIKSTKQLVI